MVLVICWTRDMIHDRKTLNLSQDTFVVEKIRGTGDGLDEEHDPKRSANILCCCSVKSNTYWRSRSKEYFRHVHRNRLISSVKCIGEELIIIKQKCKLLHI